MVTFKRRLTKYLPIRRPESAFSYGNIFQSMLLPLRKLIDISYGDRVIVTGASPINKIKCLLLSLELYKINNMVSYN